MGPVTFRENCLVTLKIEREIMETSTKWVSSRENLSFLHACKEGANQPVHSCSLIRIFDIPCLESLIARLATYQIQDSSLSLY